MAGTSRSCWKVAVCLAALLVFLASADLRASSNPDDTDPEDPYPNSETFASLSGYVYVDIDADGIRDDFERVLRGVQIILTGTDDEGEDVYRSTFTKTDGTYLFDELAAGTYEITEVQPEQFIEGPANAPGTAGGVAKGSNRFIKIVLQEVEGDEEVEGIGYNFGEWGLKPQFISKRPFLSSVPEPTSLALLATVAGCFLLLRRARS